MTVKELRDTLNKLPSSHDHQEILVEVTSPIDLVQGFFSEVIAENGTSGDYILFTGGLQQPGGTSQ